MSISPENAFKKPIDLRAIEGEAREHLRQMENPFVENFARNAEDPSCEKYDIANLFIPDPRGAILTTIDQFRCSPPRPSELFPIIGEAGSGKTHLLAWLRRKLDLNHTEDSSVYLKRVKKTLGSDGHILIVSEGFPDEQDIYGYLLRQVVDKLLSSHSHGPELLKAVSSRLTGRMLADSIRKLDSAQQMTLIPSATVWESVGRQFGTKATVDGVKSTIDHMLDACDGEELPAIPHICEAAGVDLALMVKRIGAHIDENHDGNTEGLVHRKVLKSLVRLAADRDPAELNQFLSGLIDPDADPLPGLASRDKIALKVILEILSVFKIPVVVAFDQLEDQIHGGTAEQRHELIVSFSHGVVKFLHSVPGICILIFAESSLWESFIREEEQSRYVIDRLYKPGPTKNIVLQVQLHRENVTELISTRMRPLLQNCPNADKLRSIFPFREDQLEKVSAEKTVRGCLQQLSKLYVKETSATHTAECQKKYGRQWASLRRSTLAAAPQGFKTDSIEKAHRALDYLLNDVLERRWLSECSWESAELFQSDSAYGWLNIVWFSKIPPVALVVGVWLGKSTGKAPDLQKRIDMFSSSPLREQRLLILHQDGSEALTRKSREVFEGALAKNLDIQVESLSDEELAKIMTFQDWLESVADDTETDPDKSRQIVREIIKTEMEPFFKMLQRVRTEEVKVEV